jgi:hypothetical protein
MLNFTVINMQTDVTTGWAARAYAKGLKVGSASGRFGDETHIVKDRAGNFVKLVQNTQRGRKLDASGFTDAQLEIVKALQECGLVH